MPSIWSAALVHDRTQLRNVETLRHATQRLPPLSRNKGNKDGSCCVCAPFRWQVVADIQDACVCAAEDMIGGWRVWSVERPHSKLASADLHGSMVVRISSVAMPAEMQDRRCTTAAYDSIAVKLMRGFPTEEHVLLHVLRWENRPT